MNVNATLLVQIGNFYIAYLLFRHILLRPGYQALLEKESHKRSLEDSIDHGKKRVENQLQKQQNSWILFRDWSKKELPVLSGKSTIFRGISTQAAPEEISESKKNKARSQLSIAMITALKERYER